MTRREARQVALVRQNTMASTAAVACNPMLRDAPRQHPKQAKALVAGVPNLWAVESVDSTKLASKLDAAAATTGRPERLRVFVQVRCATSAWKSRKTVTKETSGLSSFTVYQYQFIGQCRNALCIALGFVVMYGGVCDV